MVPSVWQCFRSLYNASPSYLSPVVLSQSLQEYLCPDTQVLRDAQRITSLPGVKEILSKQTYNLNEIGQRNNLLRGHNFRILGIRSHDTLDSELARTLYHSVFEHPDLDNWVIKAAWQVPQDKEIIGLSNDHQEITRFSSYESLLRLAMNQRIRNVARELGIDVAVPDEYAAFFNPPTSGTAFGQYFIISRKLNLKSPQETIADISRMTQNQQIELADKICFLIKKIGFANVSFENIRFTTDGKLAIVDTQPAGLLVASEDHQYPKGSSMEKCARIGLYNFREVAKSSGLNVISQQVDRYYQNSLNEISITKIVLSIICPLIPLVLLVLAVIKRNQIAKIAEQINQKQCEFSRENGILQLAADPAIYQRELDRFESDMRPLRERYLSVIDEIQFFRA